MLSIDDSDVYGCYWDLWRTAQERSNSQYQGIDLSDDRNMNRIRIGAGNKDETEAEDKAVADAYGNQFHIPLDFELLETHMPFNQSALGDRLEYELIFNDYSRVVVATDDAAATYTVENICLEFDMITQPDLAPLIQNQCAGRLAILYNLVLRHRKIMANKSDTLWNINLNVPARSMKGILMLFEDPAAAYQRDTEKFYNPQLTKVEVTIEGIPNQLYSQGMRAYQLWEEARKHFAAGTKRHTEIAAVLKDLQLADVSLGGFLTTKHCLWLDLGTTDDDQLHGSGRRVENASEGVTIQITKKAEAAGTLNFYLFVLMDAQLNIEDGRFVSVLYWAMLAADQPPFSDRLWTDRLREDSLYLGPSWGPLLGVSRHIVILCPQILHNKTYKDCPWIWAHSKVYVIDPGERLHDCLRALYQVFQGEPTLYIIDDCSASKALTKKKDMLSELAFSGRHAKQSIWVLTQKYNSIVKDLREQTHWVAMFHCKYRDSFEDAFCKNNVIPSREERAAVRQLLAETKHCKLLLKTDQPSAYHVLCWPSFYSSSSCLCWESSSAGSVSILDSGICCVASNDAWSWT